MENFEYSRTFPSENEDDDFSPDELEELANLVDIYEKSLMDKPRFILPQAPEIFEKTVEACEEVAREFSGRIKAKIDYSFYTATIELWCCYVEFEYGEFLSVLQEISHHALSVRFTPLESGDLHIEIMMPYFVSLEVND